MGDAAATHVAAVVLSETGPESTAFREKPDQPLEGYGIISGSQEVCSVTLFLRGARSPAFYHGWTLGEGDPLYLGAFHLGSGGEGSLSAGLSTEALARTQGFLVTAGSVVMSGPLVWMVQGAAQAAEPAPEASAEPEAEPEPPPAEAEAEAEAESEPEPEAEAEPAPDEEGPAIHPFKLIPEPATPVAGRAQLSPSHPRVTRGAGVAVLDPRSGGITLSLRGLPSPARLGADPATGRSFNAYRAWLRNRHTRSRQSMGLLERAWGDNFQLKIEGGIELADYDLVIITADDRMADKPNPQAPAVLTGALPV